MKQWYALYVLLYSYLNFASAEKIGIITNWDWHKKFTYRRYIIYIDQEKQGS